MEKLNFKKFFLHNEKPQKIDGYKIIYINAKKFRDSSLENEEFCNIAIYEDFPKSIKKDEIWIDDTILPKEVPAFLKGTLNRIKFLSKDKNSKKALDLSRIKERYYRHEHPSKLQHKKLITIHEKDGNLINVFLVNGKAVRDNYRINFSQGGHSFVYDWIPKNEIWLEKEEENELPYILAHEYTEMILMRDYNKKYEDAHKMASKAEMHYRKQKNSVNNFKLIIKNIQKEFT